MNEQAIRLIRARLQALDALITASPVLKPCVPAQRLQVFGSRDAPRDRFSRVSNRLDGCPLARRRLVIDLDRGRNQFRHAVMFSVCKEKFDLAGSDGAPVTSTRMKKRDQNARIV